MDIKGIIGSGLPVPEAIILSQATVDPTGLVYAGVGWRVSADMQAGVWGKWRPGNPQVAEGLVAVINGLRAQVGAQDDTPGVLTMAELAEVLLGVALGER